MNSKKHRLGSTTSNSSAFTLVDLLTVVAATGILVGLLLTDVEAAREAAQRMQSANNLKQLVVAAHKYESAYNRFPSSRSASNELAGWTPTNARTMAVAAESDS